METISLLSKTSFDSALCSDMIFDYETVLSFTLPVLLLFVCLFVCLFACLFVVVFVGVFVGVWVCFVFLFF